MPTRKPPLGIVELCEIEGTEAAIALNRGGILCGSGSCPLCGGKLSTAYSTAVHGRLLICRKPLHLGNSICE